MKKHWAFKYRIEFPLVICVLTTLVYSFNTDIFLFYRPNVTLFISLLIALFGGAIHIMFGKISPTDDFQFNKYSITNHTKQVGDYFIWLGCAVFSGSILVIVIFTLLYILFYGILTKKDIGNEIKQINMRRILKREAGNFVLFMLGIVYMSALKNFLIAEYFTPLNWVKFLFLISIALFIVVVYILKSPKKIGEAKDI